MPKPTIEQRLATLAVRIERMTERLDAGQVPADVNAQDVHRRVDAAKAEVAALSEMVVDA